jgi:hypothetical protein
MHRLLVAAVCILLLATPAISALAGILVAPPPKPPLRFPAATQRDTAGCSENPARSGRVSATLFGISNFANSSRNLSGPLNDIALMADSLKAANVPTKVVQDPTAADMIRSLDDMIGTAGCGDSVYVHISTHSFRFAGNASSTPASTIAIAAADTVFDPGNKSQLATPCDDTVFVGASSNGCAIRAIDLAAAIVAVRNRGADVLLVLDVIMGPDFYLSELQRDARGMIWKMAGAPGETEGPLVVHAGAGSFSLFAPGRSGAVEMRLPKGAKNGRIFGAFSFAFASAMQDPSRVSIRQIAEQTEVIYQSVVMSSEAPKATEPLGMYESSAPDLQFFRPGRSSSVSTNRTGQEIDDVLAEPTRAISVSPRLPPPSPRLAFEIVAPPLSRGYVRASATALSINGRLLDTEGLLALLIAGKPVEISFDGSFSATLPISSIGPVVELLGLFRVRESMEFRAGEINVDLQAVAPQSVLGSGRRLALMVANWDYKGTGFADLVTPSVDLAQLSEVLRTTYGFRTTVVEPDGSQLSLELVNPRKQEVLGTINRLRQLLRPDDSLLIFYAGHGMYISEVDEAYWIPRDGGKDDITSWISARDITTQLRLMPARHVLVIADSCYSGALLRGSDAANEPPTGKTERAGFLSAAFARTSRFLMSSGGVEPVQDGGGSGHSVFAAALLKGLSDTTQEAFTADELFTSYIAESVAGRSEQVPQMQPIRASGHEGGRFIFVRSSPQP